MASLSALDVVEKKSIKDTVVVVSSRIVILVVVFVLVVSFVVVVTSRIVILVVESSRTDLHDDVVDVTSFSALDVVEIVILVVEIKLSVSSSSTSTCEAFLAQATLVVVLFREGPD